MLLAKKRMERERETEGDRHVQKVAKKTQADKDKASKQCKPDRARNRQRRRRAREHEMSVIADG